MEPINQLFIDIESKNNEKIMQFFATHPVDAKDNYGRTALINAALYGNAELLKWLVEKGADLNTQDINGYTALHFAAQENQLECTKQLLSKNANPNIQDIHGNTPATVAVTNWKGGANFDTLKQLVDHKADLKLKNKAGRAIYDIIPETIRTQLGV